MRRNGRYHHNAWVRKPPGQHQVPQARRRRSQPHRRLIRSHQVVPQGVRASLCLYPRRLLHQGRRLPHQVVLRGSNSRTRIARHKRRGRAFQPILAAPRVLFFRGSGKYGTQDGFRASPFSHSVSWGGSTGLTQLQALHPNLGRAWTSHAAKCPGTVCPYDLT